MVELSHDQQSIASGSAGEGAAIAMRIVAESARLMGAPRLIPVASAHIDGALYHGDSGTLFAERLVAGGAKVAVRATLNVGSLTPAGCAKVRLAAHENDMAARMMRAYEAMGCEPSWTCAPYQAGHRPKAGTDVAWGESNAVVFCNSVLGARTNRYGDFLDIACAIAGCAPDYGLHRPENRVARLLIDASGLSLELRRSDVFYPVLGTMLGRLAGSTVAVIEGLQGCTTEDRLKALGAASASAGGVGLFHVAGVTPEAPDAATALGHVPPQERLNLTAEAVRAALAGLSTSAQTERVDAVAIGSPHLSLAEITEVEQRLAGRRLAVPLYANTGRHVVAPLEKDGRRAALEAAGLLFVVDTCVVATPILPEIAGAVLMTNSGKFAHYAPGNTGYAVTYGSLAECVESAVAGRLVRGGAVMELNAEILIAGEAVTAKCLALTAPISFWGGVDPKTGAIIDARHPQRGQNIAGTVLALPGTIGSSSASAVLLELVHAGRAPAAILMDEPDAILLLGIIVAREMGWPTPPAYRLAAAAQSGLAGQTLVISESGAIRPS